MFKLTPLIFLVVVTNFCAGDRNGKCQGNGWENAVETDKYCYTLTDSFHTVDNNQKYCVSIGGNLASIHNPEENTVVRDLCKTQSYDRYCWIGIRKTEAGFWRWYDKTRLTYENWNNAATAQDAFSYMYNNDGKWYHYKNRASLMYGICNKPLDSMTRTTVASTAFTTSASSNRTTSSPQLSTTSASSNKTTSSPQIFTTPASNTATTSSPQFNGGCSYAIREGCPEPPSAAIVEFSHNDVIHCQRVCSLNDDCNSFLFDNDAEKCYLYSSKVVNIAECHSVGGPHNPTMATCQQEDCQEFFKSECDWNGLEPVTDGISIKRVKDCEDICLGYHECRQWQIVNITLCMMYWDKPSCRMISGPKKPKFHHCK